MSDSPPLPNHIVIPFHPGQPLTYPVCEYHLEQVNRHPETLFEIEWGNRDEHEAINEAVECETFSTMYKQPAQPCELCKSFYRDLHAT